MNESVFKEILGESLSREFAEFDNAPEHKFSLRHRLAMKKVFARYEKNTRKPIELSAATMPHYSLKQRIIITLVIIILMTLLTGWIIPLHRITDEQLDWLRARYDFPTLMIYTGKSSVNENGILAGLYKETDEYVNFLDDLVYLGIYTEEDVYNIRYPTMPIDIRPKSRASTELHITPIPVAFGDIRLIDKVRDIVSTMNDEIEYYTARSQDPERAVEGDIEFAESIKSSHLELHKGFLELLEKLLANDPDEDETNSPYSALSNLDKDDRRYLSEIHKI